MVESTEERAHDLFLLGPAENVCIGRNVCAVACMVVIVDHGTRRSVRIRELSPWTCFH